MNRWKIILHVVYWWLHKDDLGFFLKNKSKALKIFRIFKQVVQNETDLKIHCLRLDNGGEFTSNKSNDYFEEHGIRRHFLIARIPQKNGVIGRNNRTMEEMDRNFLYKSKLNNIFWVQEVHIVVHFFNKGLLGSNNGKTPCELWKGRPTSVNNFRIFGSKCNIKRDDQKLGKFYSG